jgi:hypothetical protein
MSARAKSQTSLLTAPPFVFIRNSRLVCINGSNVTLALRLNFHSGIRIHYSNSLLSGLIFADSDFTLLKIG